MRVVCKKNKKIHGYKQKLESLKAAFAQPVQFRHMMFCSVTS